MCVCVCVRGQFVKFVAFDGLMDEEREGPSTARRATRLSLFLEIHVIAATVSIDASLPPSSQPLYLLDIALTHGSRHDQLQALCPFWAAPTSVQVLAPLPSRTSSDERDECRRSSDPPIFSSSPPQSSSLRPQTCSFCAQRERQNRANTCRN